MLPAKRVSTGCIQKERELYVPIHVSTVTASSFPTTCASPTGYPVALSEQSTHEVEKGRVEIPRSEKLLA
jgi:hypothetical protein